MRRWLARGITGRRSDAALTMAMSLGANGWIVDPPQVERLRVDEGQIGFWAGKFFRAYVEAVIPTAGPAVSFRFISPIDFILWSQSLVLTQGALRLEVFTDPGGTPITPSGTWTNIPIIGVNRMSTRPQPFYPSQITIQTGGSFTGGTAVDLMMVRTASQNGQSSNVGGISTERGLPATTFYGRLSTLTGGLAVNDAAQALYSIVWEERT